MKLPYSTLSIPPNDRHFVKLGGGLDKGDFYFPNLHKKLGKKFESIKFFFNLL